MTDLIRKSTKLTLIGFVVVLLIGLSVSYGIRLGRTRTPTPPPTVRSMTPTVTQLERLGELTTARIYITDVLWAEGEGYRGSWLISGDALLSCDLTKAEISDVDLEHRTATIKLPLPHVVSARVDHEKTKTWSVEKTTWLPWRWGDQGAVRDAAMFHAQQLIDAAASSERHLSPARTQAELLIRQVYEFVGWDVEVSWDGTPP